jgi:predicted acetyltransferase
MMTTPEKPSMNVELVPASPDQASILVNLLELYAHDFSEFHSLELDATGRFGYKHLSLYWSEPDRHPFLIKVEGKLAGLAFVKRGSEFSGNQNVWDVGEFFVVRAYRRKGIGVQVAHELWQRFPGLWEVRVMDSNRAALNFWQRAITTFKNDVIQPARIKKDGQCWHLFTFESPHASQGNARCSDTAKDLRKR